MCATCATMCATCANGIDFAVLAMCATSATMCAICANQLDSKYLAGLFLVNLGHWFAQTDFETARCIFPGACFSPDLLHEVGGGIALQLFPDGLDPFGTQAIGRFVVPARQGHLIPDFTGAGIDVAAIAKQSHQPTCTRS